MDITRREPYEVSIGRFMREHPDWVIMAGLEGVGYTAQSRDDRGRATGPRVSALTLDDLAVMLEEQPKP